MAKSNKTFSIISKALNAFRPRPTSPECPPIVVSQGLQEQLDYAQPAEPVWHAAEYECAGAESLGACLRIDTGDGIWVCCCGHENPLVHYQGAFPFKYLKCGRCDRILCPNCRTSEILTPIQSITTEVLEDRFNKPADEVRYCRVCRACGLTHRAAIDGGQIDFSHAPCPCGKVGTEDGSYFHIGEVDAWRRDPPARAVELSLARTMAASMRYMEKQSNDSSREYRESLEVAIEMDRIIGRPVYQTSRGQTFSYDPSAAARPQQPTRAATFINPVLPVRRGAIRSPRRKMPLSGSLAEQCFWAQN